MASEIEVELKFILSPQKEELLLCDAQFIELREFTDTYYDTHHYDLSCKGIFLRTRYGQFTLKCPQKHDNELLKQQNNSPQQEITDVAEICKLLALLNLDNIHESLSTSGIVPLYTFKNLRRKYKKDGVIIDLDKAIFDDFTYETCEIEISVQQPQDVLAAFEKLIHFASWHGLEVRPVEGRLIEYLRRKKPDHYNALKK